MGNRRLSRKRLYEVEKAGQAIDLASGAGIADAIVSATQHRQGQEIITEIAIDLGTSKAVISSATHDRDPIGVVSGGVSYITQLTEAKFGIITEIRLICVEIAASLTDLDLEFGTNGDGVNDTADTGSPTSITTAHGDAVGEDTSVGYDAKELDDKYLYLCNGATDTPDPFTAGKFLIYIHGFVAPDDL